MALVQCPECLREVSDKAVACPNCGYPLQNSPMSGKPDVEPGIAKLLAEGNTIAAIKRYRELYPGTGLAEAKKAIESGGAAPGPARGQASGRRSSGIVVAWGVLLGLVILIVIWRLVRG
jgi:hypothetical protein